MPMVRRGLLHQLSFVHLIEYVVTIKSFLLDHKLCQTASECVAMQLRDARSAKCR